MKYYKTLIISIALALTPVLKAEMAADKRAEIEKMLQLTGMVKMVDQMKGQMISSLRANMGDAPADFWDRFSAKMNGKELVEMLMPLYDKYYTTEDLRAINAFYGSPAGQKILSTMPQVMQESMQIGQAWGQKLAKQAQDEITAEAAAAKK